MDDLLTIGLSNALAAALLALVAIGIGAICHRPALVHGLWLLVLLKLVTPPLVRIPVAWPPTPESAQTATVVANETSSAIREEWLSSLPEEQAAVLMPPALPAVQEEQAAQEPTAPALVATTPPVEPPGSPSWSQVLPVVWLAGSLSWFMLALFRLHRFRRLLRFAQPAPATMQERARRLARRLGLTSCPQVGLMPGRIAPMLWAVVGPPRLLVPANLLDLLNDKQIDTLLAHELAHLRRRDHWVRILEFVVMGLYWWHPVVWYARRELREAEEQCCDAWVVSTLPGASRAYASALMDTLDFLSTAQSAVPPLASGLGQVSDLKRRLTMIMRGTTPRALSWPGCLVVLAMGAFFLPLLPTLHAQEPSKEEHKIVTIIKLDEQSQLADLDKAKADLVALEAQLKMKMAEVVKAKAALQAVVEKARAQQHKLDAIRLAETKMLDENALRGKLLRRLVAIEEANKGNTPGDEKKVMLRVEIILDKDVNIKELIKKIESVLPEKKNSWKIIPIMSDVREIPRSQIGGGTVEVPTLRTPPGVVVTPVQPRFVEDTPLRTQPGLVTLQPARPDNRRRDGEKRIDELEKTLEKVLQELQQLRKEMRSPRPSVP